MDANKRKRHFLVIIILLLITASIASYFLLKKKPAPDYIESTGVIEATEVQLTSKVAGRIERLCCIEGDPVKAGQVAAVLDSAELKARVEEARAAVTGAEQAVREAKVNLENARVQAESSGYDIEAAEAEIARMNALADDARANLERAKGLFKDGYITKKDMDAAETSYNSTIAQLDSAKARRRSAEANKKNSAVNIRAAEARIASNEAKLAQAEAQVKVISAELDDTEILSPIDGVVVYKALEIGEYVNPGAAIYTIDDLKNIWARVDIEETNIGKIKLGANATITSKDFPDKRFTGKVIEVGAVGGFATQRDVTRGRPDIKTYRVKVRAENVEGVLKPGMTVSVRIHF